MDESSPPEYWKVHCQDGNGVAIKMVAGLNVVYLFAPEFDQRARLTIDKARELQDAIENAIKAAQRMYREHTTPPRQRKGRS